MPRIISSGWKSGDLRIWSGSIENIPNGWELATEMIDRAVVGAGGAYSKGQQFGADSVGTQSRTLAASQMPSHEHLLNMTHSGWTDVFGAQWMSDTNRVAPAIRSGLGNLSYPQSWAPIEHNGGNAAHDHGAVDTRQKSIAVIWIRKL
jgi:hypothetical protein